jgi:capsid protein
VDTGDAHPAGLLDVLEAGDDLALDDEVDPDPELDSLLDHEFLP